MLMEDQMAEVMGGLGTDASSALPWSFSDDAIEVADDYECGSSQTSLRLTAMKQVPSWKIFW